MKTQLFKILHISITMLFLAACSDSRQPEILDDTPDVPIDIVVSRSPTTQGGDNAFATKFTPGCEIGISVKGRPEYQNVKYRYPANGTKLEAVDGKIYCGVQSTIEAYYPYREGGDYTHAYVTSQSSITDYYGSDALYATGTLKDNKVLNLKFEHRVAKVVFKLDQSIEYLYILNQSFSTEATTGSEEIWTHRKDETYKEWSAFIVPGQKQLEIRISTQYEFYGHQYFNATLKIPGGSIEPGRQYTFKIDKLRRQDGKAWMIIDQEPIKINDDDTYWITKRYKYGATPNYIQIYGGNPTVHLVGLDMESSMPIRVYAGNPTFIIEGENNITSTGQGRTAIGGEKGFPIVIRGGNDNPRLIVKSAKGGTGIGSGQGGGCGDITIENCFVRAEATRDRNQIYGTGGTGIGSALMAGCGNIYIKNSTIEAIGAGGGAAIGSGRGGSCGDIIIENSTITASTSNYYDYQPAIIGAGVGDIFVDQMNQPDGRCGNISITLKSGETKDEFLNGLTPADWAHKVGVGGYKSQCGTVTWYDANKNVIK